MEELEIQNKLYIFSGETFGDAFIEFGRYLKENDVSPLASDGASIEFGHNEDGDKLVILRYTEK